MKKIVSLLLAAILLFSLFSVSGSAAGTYTYGDLDANGQVNSNDALMILQHAVALKQLSAKDQLLADVDFDGTVNAGDALCVLQYATQQRTSFQKDYTKTRKYQNIDTMINSGTYTIAASMILNDFDTIMTFTANGKESAFSTVMKTPFSTLGASASELALIKMGLAMMNVPMDKDTFDMEIRYYTDKDGKSYMIVPLTRQYSEVPADEVPSDLVTQLFASENLLVSSKTETFKNASLLCEAYFDGTTTYKYYFSGKTLKYVTMQEDNKFVEYTITTQSTAATTDLLGIPNGFTKTEDALRDVA